MSQAIISNYQDLIPLEFENYFCYAAMWAFGGTLVEEHRPYFSQWWKEQWNDFVMLPGDEEVRFKRFTYKVFVHSPESFHPFQKIGGRNFLYALSLKISLIVFFNISERLIKQTDTISVCQDRGRCLWLSKTLFH